MLARPRIQVRGTDGDAAAEVKHSARMASVIRRACSRRLATPQERLAVRVGVTPVALQPPEIAKIRERVVRRDLPYEAGRTAFRNLLVDRLLEITERSVHNVTRGDVAGAFRGSKAAQDVASAAWPKI